MGCILLCSNFSVLIVTVTEAKASAETRIADRWCRLLCEKEAIGKVHCWKCDFLSIHSRFLTMFSSVFQHIVYTFFGIIIGCGKPTYFRFHTITFTLILFVTLNFVRYGFYFKICLVALGSRAHHYNWDAVGYLKKRAPDVQSGDPCHPQCPGRSLLCHEGCACLFTFQDFVCNMRRSKTAASA